MFVTPAYAQAATGAAGAGSIFGSMLFPMVMVLGIMYFLMIRPQQKQAKAHKALIEALRRGDQVVTQGGIIGKVTKVGEDNLIEVEIAEGVKVKVLRHTITTVLNKTEPAAA
ncbi:MAG: preprotein translocase subunit YajC [Paracoccaceae bacterium]